MRSESYNVEYNLSDSDEDLIDEVIGETIQDAVFYVLYGCVAILIIGFSITTTRMLILGQKARNTQQRRPYMGSRSRNSLPPTDPTIYVSPANLPPPPKYEAMAPPSYEEVVGVHYPNFQPSQIQPIAQPIAAAMAQNASAESVTNDAPKNQETDSCTPPTVLTITNERTPTASTS